MSRVLIVDDEPMICWSLRQALSDDGHQVEAVSSMEQAEDLLERFHPDAVFLDVRLPGRDGLSALPDLRERIAAAPIIVMTAFGDLETAVQAMSLGALDYLVKPFDLEQASASLSRVLQAAQHATQFAPIAPPTAGLVGRGPAMQAVFREVANCAATDLPVLIQGETGTGKELLASAIHAHSPRRDGPFVPVCLAALSPSIVESELFGHVRGAFTGAHEDRRGVFELAENGTLFLDEIGDTPLDVQVKLLRVLESRTYSRVGSGQTLRSNVRILAATHRRLDELVERGEFREDLLHRLRVFAITLPSLRERREDLHELVPHFIGSLTGVSQPVSITPAFWDELAQRDWPGNVRELRNAVESAAIRARGGVLDAIHLPTREESRSAAASANDLHRTVTGWVQHQLASGTTDGLHAALLSAVERPLLAAVLDHVAGNRTLAAKLLGLDRTTLRTKLTALGLGQKTGETE